NPPRSVGTTSQYPELTMDGVDLPTIQESLEKHYITAALSLTGGNESKAAQLLNINHHTFRYRKKKLDI
ncbi:MAG: helix-turn-helix domain-containing protein, partial [Desulfobulbaceae bacterium]|nr:helix-turn-helix domain-containing protein [Desulfobulbaceae bacterium]